MTPSSEDGPIFSYYSCSQVAPTTLSDSTASASTSCLEVSINQTKSLEVPSNAQNNYTFYPMTAVSEQIKAGQTYNYVMNFANDQ